MASLFVKRNRKIATCSLFALALLGATTSVAAFSLSWFNNSNHISNENITGGIVGAYFGGGDGKTADTAYLIKTPRHIYNLSWLQYMGFFNKDSEVKQDESGNDVTYFKPTYFKLNNDIDVSNSIYKVTPPSEQKIIHS